MEQGQARGPGEVLIEADRKGGCEHKDRESNDPIDAGAL
jgi:hypothetical protein